MIELVRAMSLNLPLTGGFLGECRPHVDFVTIPAEENTVRGGQKTFDQPLVRQVGASTSIWPAASRRLQIALAL
ncbi:hypothetical protein SALBM311S_03184 [Streptomyces alboniger]